MSIRENAIRRHAFVLALLVAGLSIGCDGGRPGQPAGRKSADVPGVAPNGHAWPVGAGYIEGLPLFNNDGQSEITVDNRSNGSNVFVKLVEQGAGGSRAVRQFHIPRGGRFTLRDVSPGNYEIRYMDLSSGHAAKSTPFRIDERRTAAGIEYSSFTLTLYTVANGNMRMQTLAAGEF